MLLSVVRTFTDPRIVDQPVTAASALGFVQALRASPRVRRLEATAATWDAFRTITDRDPLVRGNLVPDAWLAALAISHGARLATADRGSARFEGLDWCEPLRP